MRDMCYVWLTSNSSESLCLNLLQTREAIISSLFTGIYTYPCSGGGEGEGMSLKIEIF